MKLASRLTPYEKGIIDGCTLTGMSQRLIGLKIGRSQCVISNYSRLKENMENCINTINTIIGHCDETHYSGLQK